MEYTNLNNILTIKLEDRVDTTTADQIEEGILDICKQNTFLSLVIDFQDVVYISSAGLRVMLRLKKEYKDFKIINTSLEVYDVFEMTGFTDIMDVKKAYKNYSVDSLDVIGRGAKATVYRYNDDTVIKVYNDPDSLDTIQRERELSKKAFVLGIPTAISYDVVKVGDKYGSVFELLEAKSLSNLIAANPDKISDYAKVFSDNLKTIHESIVMDKNIPNAKDRVYDWINKVGYHLDSSKLDKLTKLVDEIKDTNNLVHIDYHTNNLLMQKSEALIIDMDTLSVGNKIFDFANIYAAYVGLGILDIKLIENYMGFNYQLTQEFYDKFVEIYFDNTDIELVKEKIEVLGLLRVFNHLEKRSKSFENYNELSLNIKRRIEELLDKVDSLEL